MQLVLPSCDGGLCATPNDRSASSTTVDLVAVAPPPTAKLVDDRTAPVFTKVRTEEPEMNFFLVGGGATALVASAGARTEGSYGIGASGRFETFMTKGIVSFHGGADAAVGGSSGGFDGQIHARLMVGARWPIRKSHGPFLHAGLNVGNTYLGFAKLQYGLFELPAEVGYMASMGDLQWMAGGRLGFYGAFFGMDVGGSELAMRSRYSPIGYGSFLSLAIAKPVGGYVKVEWTRELSAPATPFDVLAGSLCGTIRSAELALCLDVTHLRGRADDAPYTQMIGTFAGLSLGWGGLGPTSPASTSRNW